MPGPMTDQVMTACAAHFDVIRLWEAADPAAVLRDRSGDVQAIASAGDPPIDAELIGRLPSLQIIASHGVGYDAVDVLAAAERGVLVTNTPDVLTDDVADIAIALLLMTVRELSQAQQFLRAGQWEREGPFRLAPTRVKDRSIGILGLGRIGLAIARRAEAFGADISYHNRNPRNLAYHYCSSVVELADRVDTLVIATPGGSQTRHLVDAGVLCRLGERGILINVARGTVVDERALIDALTTGAILAAGLDVFEREPTVPPELRELPNATLLPHVGSASVRTRTEMGQLVVDNLRGWFDTGTVLTPVAETPQPEPRAGSQA